VRLEARIEELAERYKAGQDVHLRIKLWNGRHVDLSSDPKVTITLTTPAAALQLLRPNLSVLGEAYIEGKIELEGPIGEVIRAGEAFTRRATVRKPFAPWRLRSHSRRLDAEAIRHHYDVSNEFYQLWLDREMVYSCAYFKTGQEDLHTAQEQKLDHLCRKLMLRSGERFLDIGCGWGALIRWAVKHYGVTATGVTLSRNQYDYARERIQREGLQDRCQVLLCDYRDLPVDARYDKIASVGMVEHVGRKNFPVYFGVAHRHLTAGGLILNHGISTSESNDGAHALGGGDFIERYVFPHGETPPLSLVLGEMGRQHLEVTDVESLRPHYTQTLRLWVSRLEAHRSAALALVGEKRYRIWLIYMAACAHAFEQGWVSVYQVLAGREDEGLQPLPWTREHVYRHDASTEPARTRWP